MTKWRSYDQHQLQAYPTSARIWRTVFTKRHKMHVLYQNARFVSKCTKCTFCTKRQRA